jgi:hypothetical protein
MFGMLPNVSLLSVTLPHVVLISVLLRKVALVNVILHYVVLLIVIVHYVFDKCHSFICFLINVILPYVVLRNAIVLNVVKMSFLMVFCLVSLWWMSWRPISQSVSIFKDPFDILLHFSSTRELSNAAKTFFFCRFLLLPIFRLDSNPWPQEQRSSALPAGLMSMGLMSVALLSLGKLAVTLTTSLYVSCSTNANGTNVSYTIVCGMHVSSSNDSGTNVSGTYVIMNK